MFCIYSMYDREHVDKLIDAYFTEGCSAETRIKIYCYIAVCGLLWSNWCEYKRNLGIDFAGMAPYGQEDEGLTAGEMGAIGAGTLGAGALAAGARYAVPAAQAAYNARTNSGANLTGTMMAAKQAAATPFNNDMAAVRQVAGAAQNGYNNVVGAAQNAAQVVTNPSGFKSGYGMAMKDPLLGKMAAYIDNPSVRAGAKVGNVANTIGKTISNIRTKVTRRA
jgi:hypothetical protein